MGAERGQEAARRVLEAVLAGEAPARDDMLELADEVLGRPLVRAALEVKAGGALATVRAGEIAVALLARTRAETGATAPRRD